jgi:outer membrane protein OmpA-like peptidoglycan-associated protein
MLFKKSNKKQDDSFWISTADLMACLMILFMFIAILYISISKAYIVKYEEGRLKIGNAIENFQGNGINIDKETLTATFPDGESLFLAGSDKLTEDFERRLYSFLPKYIELLYKKEFRDMISEIRIEGHTSSEWDKNTSETDAYFENMNLSQKRTRAVLKYMLEHPQLKQYSEWMKEHITANGLSSSHLIMKKNQNGYIVEDKEKSRRVEFRIVTDSEEVIKTLSNSQKSKK